MKKGFHCWQNPSVNSFQFQIQIPVLAPALVCDDHAYCAAAVLLFTYKHAIKVHFLGLRHPRHHDKFQKLLILT